MPVPPRCLFYQDAPNRQDACSTTFPTPDSRLPIPDSRPLCNKIFQNML
ncbi:MULTISPECIES: hypothetical protein [unclassified Moorena]|nr:MULTISPECIES: hypothetical protein [unclassified Moorena]NEO22705.1 hypothetical protein [Moorena sp. SIO4A5]NEQ55902.1 hypothetical protein [Moorena sp. SIO4A1]